MTIFFYKPYPGNDLAEQLRAAHYAFPCTLEEWANFDYIGSADPWISAATYHPVEQFRFYQKYAYGRSHHPLAQSMQILARWRVNHAFYHFPWSAARSKGCAPARA